MTLTPEEIVAALDKFVVGQNDAKKSVAVAMRDRWRRQQLPEAAAAEIYPANILLVGPTGSGKTEIARRLSKLEGIEHSPMVKTQATRFTEVGIYGSDVSEVVGDLVRTAYELKKSEAAETAREASRGAAERVVLRSLMKQHGTAEGRAGAHLLQQLKDGLLDDEYVDVPVSAVDSVSGPGAGGMGGLGLGGFLGRMDLGAGGAPGARTSRGGGGGGGAGAGAGGAPGGGSTKLSDQLRPMLASVKGRPVPPGFPSHEQMEEMLNSLDRMGLDLPPPSPPPPPPPPSSSSGAGATRSTVDATGAAEKNTKEDADAEEEKEETVRMTVKEAVEAATRAQAANDVAANDAQIRTAAVELAEQRGIVFIDEIDKLILTGGAGGGPGGGGGGRGGAFAKGEGVQKELLGLVEGTTIETGFGPVRTDHVLFIAAGAFHQAKPSELLPELQGRLPVRVSLSSLEADDFEKILTGVEFNLVQQTQQLLGTEGLAVEFTADGVRELAESAAEMNARLEDIGARRLRTITSKVVEELSFSAPRLVADGTTSMVIDRAFVRERLESILDSGDNVEDYIL